MPIKVPMLSPVLEDFVPPQFRGNVPDEVVETPTAEAATQTTEGTSTTTPPPNWWSPEHDKNSLDSNPDEGVNIGVCGPRVALLLLQWRKRSQRGPVQVPQRKPVQVQGLRRHVDQKSPRARRSTGLHYINPLCLLAKLRDTYIHMMNNVATSKIVAGAAHGPDTSSTQSPLFFSREFDAQSIAQLLELDRSSSKPDTEYRQNMTAFSRNSAKVKPCGDVFFMSELPINKPGAKSGGDSVLSRSKSKTFSDDVFFSKNGSRRKKNLRINPYLDSDWKAPIAVSETKAEGSLETKNEGSIETKSEGSSETKANANDDHNIFQFRTEETKSPGTERWLQQATKEGSLFTFIHN